MACDEINKKSIFNKNKIKGHPYSPCKKCLVQASCDLNEHMYKCQPLLDYHNAIDHKDPFRVCTFIINSFGVWQSFMSVPSSSDTIEHMIRHSMGKRLFDGPVFDYDKHVEYTKYLESLEYYDLL